MSMEILQGLNPKQQLAVTTTEGYVRVVAGAGTGKTKALTHRYAYLVNGAGIPPAHILCVTFTNKAANEMRRRIRRFIGDQDTAYISTFHGFCVTILREDIHLLQYPKSFVVLDTEDTKAILERVYQDNGYSSRTMTFKKASEMIEIRKYEAGEQIHEFLDLANDSLKGHYQRAVRFEDKIFFGYLLEQKKNFGLDFNDLMILALYLLEHHRPVREKWQERLQYVMVDEFQDVSATQYQLADILSRHHQNLFVVGDPDQNIYSWRGSKVEFILHFEQRFPTAVTIILDDNYRSTPEILAAANSLIQKNRNRVHKDLAAHRDHGPKVLYHHHRTEKEEADWIAGKIRELQEQGTSLSGIAVLYRSHFVSRSVEEALVTARIPYVLFNGIEFYKRKEIKDILSYLRMLITSDDLSFRRIVNEPRRGIGRKRIQFLENVASVQDCSLYEALCANLEEPLLKSTGASDLVVLIRRYQAVYRQTGISDLLDGMLHDSGYEAMIRGSGDQERLDNLAELKQAAVEYENSAGEAFLLEDYLGSIALFTNIDQADRRDAVKLMTTHTAKGLEFPCVFVCGLNEGIMPSKRISSRDELEEERRIAYVAFTRAEKALYLTDSEGVHHDHTFKYPSRFILNVDRKYLDYAVELPENLRQETAGYVTQNEQRISGKMERFEPDERVKHPVFGHGTVLEVVTEPAGYRIQFDTLPTSRTVALAIALERAE